MYYSIIPCIFILSAVSYLKTEIILFHVRESVVLYQHLYGKTHHIRLSSIQLLHIVWLYLLFLRSFLFMLYLRNKVVDVTIIILGTSFYKCYFSRGNKVVKFVLVTVYLSQILAKLMHLYAVKVWLEFMYFWTVLLCQCVHCDDRSRHKRPIKSANVKIKHNDNAYGEELNILTEQWCLCGHFVKYKTPVWHWFTHNNETLPNKANKYYQSGAEHINVSIPPCHRHKALIQSCASFCTMIENSRENRFHKLLTFPLSNMGTTSDLQFTSITLDRDKHIYNTYLQHWATHSQILNRNGEERTNMEF